MADVRDSFSHASPESLQRRADSWSRTPVIIFDSTEGKLYRAPESEAEGYARAIMPGKDMRADIYLDLGKLDDLHGAWLAKVDLTKLGLTARWKRKTGGIKYVYIKTANQARRSVKMK